MCKKTGQKLIPNNNRFRSDQFGEGAKRKANALALALRCPDRAKTPAQDKEALSGARQWLPRLALCVSVRLEQKPYFGTWRIQLLHFFVEPLAASHQTIKNSVSCILVQPVRERSDPLLNDTLDSLVERDHFRLFYVVRHLGRLIYADHLGYSIIVSLYNLLENHPTGVTQSCHQTPQVIIAHKEGKKMPRETPPAGRPSLSVPQRARQSRSARTCLLLGGALLPRCRRLLQQWEDG